MRRITGSDGYYRLSASAPIDAAVAHTAAGSALVCESTAVGVTYQRRLAEATRSALKMAADHDPALAADLDAAVPAALYVLRGGLNFAVHDALEELTGRACEVSFVTSERAVVAGAATVRDDGYRKYSLVPGSLLVLGDIAATGRTIINTLGHLVRDHPPASLPRRIVLVVIGTATFLDHLETFLSSAEGDLLVRSGCRISVLYLEGAFALYGGEPRLPGHVPGTDFVRAGAVLTPGAWTAAFRQPLAILERCVIYDGGARGFSPRAHLGRVRTYWARLDAAIRLDPGAVGRLLCAKIGMDVHLTSYDDWKTILRCSAPENELSSAYSAARAMWRSARNGEIAAACAAHLTEIDRRYQLLIGVSGGQVH